ncbi:MAG: GNAT family N-acetyltransferase [Gemmatimonadales bacterium]|nr:GNAT family N-acetyltransferase [Gemmatimonadales bacterium]MDZ4390588.1 GNAT family N-acetyltransferase [Gemmatimonadales bacterium]
MTGVDLQPTLPGELVTVRPLRADDWTALYQVASDRLIWEQHPASDRYREEVFREFFRVALELRSAFVVLDAQTGAVIGSTRYHGHDFVAREIEIGWTFLARSHWGGRYNAELKQLMLDHAFGFVDRVIFVIGRYNIRSRRAIEKSGAVLLEGHPASGPDRVVYGIDGAAGQGLVRNLNRAQ